MGGTGERDNEAACRKTCEDSNCNYMFWNDSGSNSNCMWMNKGDKNLVTYINSTLSGLKCTKNTDFNPPAGSYESVWITLGVLVSIAAMLSFFFFAKSPKPVKKKTEPDEDLALIFTPRGTQVNEGGERCHYSNKDIFEKLL